MEHWHSALHLLLIIRRNSLCNMEPIRCRANNTTEPHAILNNLSWVFDDVKASSYRHTHTHANTPVVAVKKITRKEPKIRISEFFSIGYSKKSDGPTIRDGGQDEQFIEHQPTVPSNRTITMLARQYHAIRMGCNIIYKCTAAHLQNSCERSVSILQYIRALDSGCRCEFVSRINEPRERLQNYRFIWCEFTAKEV